MEKNGMGWMISDNADAMHNKNAQRPPVKSHFVVYFSIPSSKVFNHSDSNE